MDNIVRFCLTLSTLASDRLLDARRNDRGQGTIEYVGMIIVAAIIVVALLETDMGGRISDAFTTRIGEVIDFG